MKKQIAVLLALALLIPAAAGCANNQAQDAGEEVKTPTADASLPAAEETEEPDPFEGVDFDGRTFSIYTSVNEATVGVESSNYLIEGYEEYTNEDADAPIRSDRVPLQDVVVTIDNALSSNQEVYGENGAQPGQVVDMQSNQLALDSLGQATYKWKAGLPNIVEPYTRTISISYEIDDRGYQWSGSGLAGIILGDMPTGNNFVTAGPDAIDMILRDPPGSQSKTTWTKGTVRIDHHSTGGVWRWDDKTTVTKHFGYEIQNGVGGLEAF